MQWKLFADLADVTGKRVVEVDLDGDASAGDALDALLERYPALEERVLDDAGGVESHINVLVNGSDVSTGEGLETTVEEDDELALFPPVTGG